MGASTSNNESSQFQQQTTETQRIVFIRVQPNPVQIYQEAIILCKQDRYVEALQRFLTVMKMRPDFPNIGRNVIQCTLLVKALKIYQEGILLLKMGRTIDALKRFEYIEEELQPDFKDCRQLIVACRKKVWIEQLEHSILFQMITQKQQQQEAPPEIQMIQSFFELLAKIGQARRNQNHEDEEESQQQDEVPDFDYENLDKLPIYYICQKKPQCQSSSNGQKPFRHNNCGTYAYFHASGMISCDDGCDQYSISDALFSCENQEVSNREDQQDDDDDYECIREQKFLADFVEDCLCKDKHNESLKNQFRMGVAGGAFIEMLKNN